MERLTFEGNFCEIAQCYNLPCPYNGSCTQKQVWERLRAYEDTELMPEEVKEMAKTLMLRNNEILELSSDRRWIPVAERLPENEREVLVCTKSKNGSRNVDKGYILAGRWVRRGMAEVTHWMPLPPNPEALRRDENG